MHPESRTSTTYETQTAAPPALSRGTLRALAWGAGRELRWGLPGVAREVCRWKTSAEQIPDPTLRDDALGAIADKRYYTDGAALFWILPTTRSTNLLALLATYQTIANYLDYASERGAQERGSCGGSLMLALVDAIDPDAPLRDYYAGHPWRDDGGYLNALVLACQRRCRDLPRYAAAAPLAKREARRAEALELCHEPDPALRDAALSALAAREFAPAGDASWREQVGSATSLLAVIVLLALAADEDTTTADLEAAAAVYSPWVGALSLVLDSYVDQAADANSGDWSFLAVSYDSRSAAEARIAELMARALRDVGHLRHGPRHVLIVSMMIAMYLTSDGARAPDLAHSTRRLGAAAGTLTAMLMPILSAWRKAYGQHG
jgi:tetraprenyl-beta-curcumene synthase